MALEVRWTKEAEDTFAEIVDYLDTRWTEKEIKFFVHETQKVIGQIEKNPYQFKASRVNEVRKAFITKHTSLFYGVNGEEQIIVLYAFWDNRRDPENLKY